MKSKFNSKLLIIYLKIALDLLAAEQVVMEMSKAALQTTMEQLVKKKSKDTVDPYLPGKTSKGMLVNTILDPYLLLGV